MNPHLTATEKGVSASLCVAIGMVYRGLKAGDFVKQIIITTGVQCEAVVCPAIGGIPPSAWIFDGARLGIAVFQGVTPSSGLAFAGGLGPNASGPATGGVNAAIFQGWRWPGFRPLQTRLENCELQLLGGHSLGGLAAVSISSLMAPPIGLRKRGVVCFGSPRGFRGPPASIRELDKFISWVAPGDAVTLFPPRGVENLINSALIATVVDGWPDDFHHPGSLRVLNESGGFTLNNIIWSQPGLSAVDMSLFLSGLPSSLSYRHELVRYNALITGLIEDDVRFWSPDKPEPPRESMSLPILTQVESVARAAAGFPAPIEMRCQRATSIR